MTEDFTNDGAPVSDRLLGRLAGIARDARAGRASPAAAEMLLHLAPDLLHELLVYRQMLGRDYAAEHLAAAMGGNVVRLATAARPRAVEPVGPGAA